MGQERQGGHVVVNLWSKKLCLVGIYSLCHIINIDSCNRTAHTSSSNSKMSSFFGVAPSSTSPTCPQKAFTQCFWHANGQLVCENTVVPMVTPDRYVQFNAFGQPNAKYAPNAYRSNKDFYETQRQPTCNVPCTSECTASKQAYVSPPRDPSSRSF